MGKRGEAWVAGQVLIFILFALAPRIGPMWSDAVPISLAGWSLLLIGAGLGAWSALNLGRSLTPMPRPLEEGRLVTHGTYRFVRHPIYSGIVLAALGIALLTASWPRLGLGILLLLFFDRKARVEERWLEQKYPGYAAYRTRVKKLIPWIY